jgi:hypothetical protein
LNLQKLPSRVAADRRAEEKKAEGTDRIHIYIYNITPLRLVSPGCIIFPGTFLSGGSGNKNIYTCAYTQYIYYYVYIHTPQPERADMARCGENIRTDIKS